MAAAKPTDKATPKKKDEIFLATLAECGNVTRAAEAAKLNRCHLYRRRNDDPAFAKAWGEAAAIGVAALEDEARRRAYEGWKEPVYYQGEECGTVRKFSDTLLIVLLKAHMPDKYQERQKVDHSSADGSMTPAPAIDLSNLSMDELVTLARAVNGKE